MKINIQTPGFKARPELLELIDEKVGKLSRLSDRILEVNVLVKTDKSDTRENKVCEITLVIPGNDLFAKAQSQTFEQAVHETVTMSKRQITDWNEEKKQHRQT